MPFRSFGFQLVKRKRRTALAGPAYGKFGNHNGESQDCQKEKVNQYEGRASVFAGDKRKAPDIA